MNTQVVWSGGGLQFTGTPDSGNVVTLGGSDQEGIGPMEMVLTGLAGCTAMDVISILQKKRQKVNAFEVKVHAERAEEVPKVFTEITVKYIVRGEKIDPVALERAMELSETKYCPVHKMLSKAAKIHLEYEIIEEPYAAAGE